MKEWEEAILLYDNLYDNRKAEKSATKYLLYPCKLFTSVMKNYAFGTNDNLLKISELKLETTLFFVVVVMLALASL